MARMTKIPAFVNCAWLADHLDDNDIQVVDATWYLSGDQSGIQAWQKVRIPGAIHVDIDFLSAPVAGPPWRMAPKPADFARLAGASGLRSDNHIIVYDQQGLYSSARIWFLLRLYGHEAVSVLNGGFPEWNRHKFPVESGPPASPSRTCWTVRPASELIWHWTQVLENIQTQRVQLVDVRPPEMFNGDTSSLYPNVRAGHIPGSLNFSQRQLSDEGIFVAPLEARRRLCEAGIDLDQPVVATCGSGVTACILSLALCHIGLDPCPIYDGSWEEWGQCQDLPAEIDVRD